MTSKNIFFSVNLAEHIELQDNGLSAFQFSPLFSDEIWSDPNVYNVLIVKD